MLRAWTKTCFSFFLLMTQKIMNYGTFYLLLLDAARYIQLRCYKKFSGGILLQFRDRIVRRTVQFLEVPKSRADTSAYILLFLILEWSYGHGRLMDQWNTLSRNNNSRNLRADFKVFIVHIPDDIQDLKNAV